MPVRVADASVVAAIAFREPEAQRALQLVEGHDIHAPRLLAYELASVARKKVDVHATQREVVFRALRRSLALAIGWDEVDHEEVVRLALKTGLTTYDASYLQLARALEATLLTFDHKLLRAAESTGVSALAGIDI